MLFGKDIKQVLLLPSYLVVSSFVLIRLMKCLILRQNLKKN